MSIRVVNKFISKPEKLEEFIALMKQLEENTKREDRGVIGYSLHQDMKDPNCIAMMEEWENEEVMEEHLSKQHFLDLLPAISECLGAPPSFNNFKAI